MKIKFDTDDNLPLNKELKLHMLTIIVRSVFEILSQTLFRGLFVWIIKMLQYEKIDISEEIDTNKTRASKECMLCHYCYFKDVEFKFKPHVCTKCQDTLMTAYVLY